MYKSAHCHDSLTGGIAVKGHLARAKTACRLNGVSFSFHFQFKPFLTGNASALLTRDDLAVTALTGYDQNGFAFAAFHQLIKPGTVQQIVLHDFAGR